MNEFDGLAYIQGYLFKEALDIPKKSSPEPITKEGGDEAYNNRDKIMEFFGSLKNKC